MKRFGASAGSDFCQASSNSARVTVSSSMAISPMASATTCTALARDAGPAWPAPAASRNQPRPATPRTSMMASRAISPRTRRMATMNPPSVSSPRRRLPANQHDQAGQQAAARACSRPAGRVAADRVRGAGRAGSAREPVAAAAESTKPKSSTPATPNPAATGNQPAYGSSIASNCAQPADQHKMRGKTEQAADARTRARPARERAPHAGAAAGRASCPGSASRRRHRDGVACIGGWPWRPPPRHRTTVSTVARPRKRSARSSAAA
jgi:hypothetical protein